LLPSADVDGEEDICYSFLNQGRYLAVGTRTGIKLFESDYGKPCIRTYSGNLAPVIAIAVSPDERFICAVSDDQTIRFWNVKTGEAILTFFSSFDGRWIAWTPQGYYKASPGGDNLISWHLNRNRDDLADILPTRLFRWFFERPDIIDRIFDTGNVNQAIVDGNLALKNVGDFLEIFNIHEDIANFYPPRVNIKSPLHKERTAEKQITMEIVIHKNEEQEIREIHIRNNGRPIPSWNPKLFKQTPGIIIQDQMISFSVDVPLHAGENPLEVFAISDKSTSSTAQLTVHCDVTYEEEKGNLYLIAIGIDDYEQGLKNLRFARKDAETFGSVFEDKTGTLFDVVHSTILVNEKATRANILDAIEKAIFKVGKNDTLVFYYAGHGLFDEHQRYWLSTRDSSPNNISDTGIDFVAIQEKLQLIPGKPLLLLDSCHSGVVTEEPAIKYGQKNMNDIVKSLTNMEVGLQVLTASQGDQYAFEDARWNHGVFTMALLEVIQNSYLYRDSVILSLPADKNLDSIIDFDEIRSYVIPRVKEITNSVQIPTGYRQNYPRLFPVVEMQK